MKHRMKKAVCLMSTALLAASVLSDSAASMPIRAEQPRSDENVIYAADYGADPTGCTDSARAVTAALEAARDLREKTGRPVRLVFEKGEYHIYKDHASVREIHTSNTNSIDYPEKTIGILIENQQDLTIEGNGSLFMMHGNMMALAVTHSSHITLQNFSWDFETPTTTEMTIVGMSQESGREVTEFYIPRCFPYEITGNTIRWMSEPSPYTGQRYWSATGIHNTYSVSARNPVGEFTRRFNTTTDSPFHGAESIHKVEDSGGTRIRITYSNGRPAMQQTGMTFELNSAAVRETAGAMIWESEDVTCRGISVHYMHGFGWLLQMCRDVFFYDCAIEPRKGSSHVTASYADGIHASGAAGKLVIENCRFSDLHDDPINIHGTFTRVERRIDDHTLQLNYIHRQQGGFPQFHAGDKVQFFTRDSLESSDQEAEYTVAEVISNPGENGNDLRTMVVRFEETVPAFLTETLGTEPRYVAENVTYTPEVTIRNSTFRDLSARGILCTTRKKTLIENNVFYNTSMATIFLSNDSSDWYESGPIRDMTIRGNTFYIKDSGERSWEYRSAVYIHPVTKNGGLPDYTRPIHKNITIENNTFHMDSDTVVKAESVENLSIRNNRIIRTNPDLLFSLAADSITIQPGTSAPAGVRLSGSQRDGLTENMYEFTKCRNVRIQGNAYDDGQKLYARYQDMPQDEIAIEEDAATRVSGRDGEPFAAHAGIEYISSRPDVASVSSDGIITAHSPGTASIITSTWWNGSLLSADPITVQVPEAADDLKAPQILHDFRDIITQPELSLSLAEETGSVSWSIEALDGDEIQGRASVDANGHVTFTENGNYLVRVSNAAGSDEKLLVYHSGSSPALTRGYDISRRSDRLTLDGTSARILLERGDLYKTDNSVKNLIRYVPADDFDTSSFRTAVFVENLPVNESSQWDTASFLLMADEDNYISAGRKSHFHGIATVVEQNGDAVETHGSQSHDSLTSGWIGLTREGGTVSVDFSTDGSEWIHIRTIETDLFDSANPVIAMAAWHTNDRSKSVTFRDFHLSDTAADYVQLLNTPAVPFNNAPNSAPILSDVQYSTALPEAGRKISLLTQASDAENDSIEQYMVLWTLQAEDGTLQRKITRSLEWIPPVSGTLSATLCAIDSAGSPARPVTLDEIQVAPGADTGLQSIQVGGREIWNSGSEESDVSIRVPASLDSTALDAKAAGSWLVNGQQTAGPVLLDLSQEQTLQVSDSDRTVRIHISRAGNSACEISGLSVDGWTVPRQPELQMVRSNTVRLEGFARGGSTLRVYHSRNPQPVYTGEPGEALDLMLEAEPGVTTYLVESLAEDGISRDIQAVHLFREPSADCAITALALNGTPLGLSENDQKADLPAGTRTASLLVSTAQNASLNVLLNGRRVECQNGQTALLDNLQPGRNTLMVVSKAEDEVSKEIRIITLYVRDTASAALDSITIDGTAYTPDLLPEKLEISRESASIQVCALDGQSLILISDGRRFAAGLGTVSLDASFALNRNEITIAVLSPDGTVSEQKTLHFEKAAYLSDLDWSPSSTTGYGSLQKDLNLNGEPIRLCRDDQSAQIFERGIGAHADASILFELPAGQYKRLQGAVGVDYGRHSSVHANIDFSIETDGDTVFTSGTMLGTTPMKFFDIDLDGVTSIALKAVQSQDSNWDAHADFAGCRLIMDFASDTASSLNFTKLNEECRQVPSCSILEADPEVLARWISLLDEVNDVRHSTQTTQSRIDELAAAVQSAREALEGMPVQFDLTLLDTALARAASLNNLEEFISEGQDEFFLARNQAQSIRVRPLSQQNINEAAARLNAAILCLRRTPSADSLPE